MASQPRKVLVCRYACCLLRSFNGAVASQPRKGPTLRVRPSGVPASMGPWLRSHGRVKQLGLTAAMERASMGPWLRSHGRSRRPSQKPGPWHCFNGAVASQPRKVLVRVGHRPRLRRFNGAVASQPRKGLSRYRVTRSPWLLQWGRGFAATEGKESQMTNDTSPHASMGPWLRSHGR